MRFIYKSLVLISLFGGVAGKTYSQDMQLSQFDAAPLFYNPALSGNFDGIHRFIGNYKNQWKTYNTGLLSYDRMLPDKLTYGGGKFGLGGMVTWDKAGEISYGYTQAHLMPSYHVPIIPNDILFLSAGLDLSFTQNSLASDKVILDYDQYGNPIYGSAFTQNLYYFDVAAGINAYTLYKGYPINLGITLHHLARPGKSPIGGDNINNARRFSVNANTIVKLNENMAFLPSLIWLNQKPSNEVNFGTYFRYSFNKTPYAAYVGSWWRIGDAIIAGVAVDFPGIKPNHVVTAGLSYDITLSSYRKGVSNDKSKIGNNSIEFSVKYIIKKANFKYTPPAKLNPTNF